MKTVRSRILVVLTLSVVLAAALPAAAGAAGSLPTPQAGPLSPGFVEALHDPLVAVGLGHVPSPVSVHVGATARARAASEPAPGAYSLVEQGRVSAVRNQGGYGTCWAFANIAAIESRLLPGQRWDLSEDNLVGRSGFGASKSWRYNWGGYDFMAVAYFARWAGPVTEADDPYPSPTLPKANRVRKHVQGVAMIPGRASALDNALIKQLVLDHGALSVGMYWDGDAYNDYESGGRAEHAAYYLPDERGENHGVNVVGWDDSFPAADFTGAYGSPPADGAFLVRNSWGRGFGERGYFWVSYFDASFARDQTGLDNGGCTSYTLVSDTSGYARNYQYDALGVTDRWGYPGGPDPTQAWGANRFTATATQSIVAAGFYTLAANTRYEIWAGRGLGSLTRRATGSTPLPGYSTVALDTPLDVGRGDRFVVAVRLTSPSETYPLAVERPATSWQLSATARRGQSFMSHDGQSWTDLNAGGGDANVCLKAFAK